MPHDYKRRHDAAGYRRVLDALRTWDPLGVISDENRDEYDGYAPTIIHMLDVGATKRELYRHLRRLAVAHMAVRCNHAKTRQIARKLVTGWQARGGGEDDPERR